LTMLGSEDHTEHVQLCKSFLQENMYIIFSDLESNYDGSVFISVNILTFLNGDDLSKL
jgi:hypothetical protein